MFNTTTLSCRTTLSKAQVTHRHSKSQMPRLGESIIEGWLTGQSVTSYQSLIMYKTLCWVLQGKMRWNTVDLYLVGLTAQGAHMTHNQRETPLWGNQGILEKGRRMTSGPEVSTGWRWDSGKSQLRILLGWGWDVNLALSKGRNLSRWGRGFE